MSLAANTLELLDGCGTRAPASPSLGSTSMDGLMTDKHRKVNCQKPGCHMRHQDDWRYIDMMLGLGKDRQGSTYTDQPSLPVVKPAD